MKRLGNRAEEGGNCRHEFSQLGRHAFQSALPKESSPLGCLRGVRRELFRQGHGVWIDLKASPRERLPDCRRQDPAIEVELPRENPHVEEVPHPAYRSGLGRDDLRVGMVVLPQRFGDRVNPHLHRHTLARDGAFDSAGVFHPMPFDMQGDIEVLTRLFAKRVLDLMVRRKRLSQRLHDEMLGWEHSGFSADGSVKVAVGDYGRLKRLVRYLARPAVSAERVAYDRTTGTVTVRSSKKVHGVRPVVAQYDALTFLSLLALQVPPPGVHMVRYYGYYSVRSRAERRRRTGAGQGDIHSEAPPPATIRRRNWAQLLRQVFEVDVLRCDKCAGVMKIISFITTTQDQVIRRILEHLGVSTVVPRAPGPPEWMARRELDEPAALAQEEEDFSQAPPDWDKWEPA